MPRTRLLLGGLLAIALLLALGLAVGALAFEPDAAIDVRVHAVHARSQRFAALGRITDCALCHLTPPAGPARGLLPSP
jgi:hypothetical protein